MAQPAHNADGGWFGERLTDWSPAQWPIAGDWREPVDGFFASDCGQRLGAFVRSRLTAGAIIFPPQPLRMLAVTPLQTVKVVVLGQDPYHGRGQAQGLAFSVAQGARIPPSLVNIRAEIARERQAGELEPARSGAGLPAGSGDLTCWSRQGVLLLNTCLTVEQGLAGSHAQRGWEAFCDALVAAVNNKPEPVVFMLWGAHAQSRRPAPATEPVGAPRLHLLANHPSPLSARRSPLPFLGCGHFALANAFLVGHGRSPIEW